MAERVPRGPTGVPVFGSSLRFASDPLGFIEQCAQEYGDFVRVETLNGEIYILTDPEGIKHVLSKNSANYQKPDLGGEGLDGLLGDGLLTSEGDLWLSERKRIQPAFHRQMLDRYTDIIVGDARELAETFHDRERIDGDEAMSLLTLRIIVETVLGAELGGMEREISDALEDVGQKFRSDDVRTLVPDRVPTPRNVKYRVAERRLERVVRDIVRQRERGSQSEPRHVSGATASDERGSGSESRQEGNMLSLLLAARDAGAVEIDDDQLRDEVLTMLLAGHDTTALTLTYSWYLLSEHPSVERRFHEELDSVLNHDDPTAETVSQLDYTEAVVKEAMRLYPPAYTIYRQAIEADTIGDFHLSEGAIVMLPQWVVHRDSRWWDDPDEFNPERWLEENRERPDYAYFPFGGGPRRCIGGEFATREAKLVLGTIGRRFSLRYLGDDAPTLVPMVTLHPEPPVEFEVRAR